MEFYKGIFGLAQTRCFQHMLDKGCAIHPAVLISAARCGDVELVRVLHPGGVPLWKCVWEEEVLEGAREVVPGQGQDPAEEQAVSTKAACMCGRLADCERMKILAIPRDPQDADHMWKALMYGSVFGAPVTPAMEEVLRAKRASTRAVLLAFHVADRLSRGEGSAGRLGGGKGSAGRLGRGKGSEEQRAAWSVMGRMSLDVVGKILVLADSEIPESLRRSLFGKPPAGVRGRIARVCLVHVEGNVYKENWEFVPARSS
jgi:hypothetical protein